MIAGHTHLLRMDVDPFENEVPQEELIDYLKRRFPRLTRYWFQITEKAYGKLGASKHCSNGQNTQYSGAL